jgi:hypothetical protein
MVGTTTARGRRGMWERGRDWRPTDTLIRTLEASWWRNLFRRRKKEASCLRQIDEDGRILSRYTGLGRKGRDVEFEAGGGKKEKA